MKMQRLYQNKSKPISNKDKTLFWVPGGMPLMLHVETSIAAGLKLRGSEVHAVICDGVYSACVRREIIDQKPIEEWKSVCHACKNDCAKVLNEMGIPYTFIGDYIKKEDLTRLEDEAKEVTWSNLDTLSRNGVNIGQNVHSSILRYLKGYDAPVDPRVIFEYTLSGLICYEAAKNAFSKHEPQRVFMSHGCYVDWGPALRESLRLNIPVVSWMASYLSAHFYFRFIDNSRNIDVHGVSEKSWKSLILNDLSPEQHKLLDGFIENRYKHNISFDMKAFKGFLGKSEEILERFNLPKNKPIWGILTHINWDSVSDFSPMIFGTFNEWILKTIEILLPLDNIQWVIKIHPAETMDSNPQNGVESVIRRKYPNLPEHIRIFSAEENINPLDFYNVIDGGITVFGTAGLEMALMGKPVILAGEAHYSGKGFTFDSHNFDSYTKHLKETTNLKALSDEEKRLARHYAYLYFFRRQVPLSVVNDPNSHWWSFQFEKRENLVPGKDKHIDFICQNIMSGNEFILPDHLIRSTI